MKVIKTNYLIEKLYKLPVKTIYFLKNYFGIFVVIGSLVLGSFVLREEILPKEFFNITAWIIVSLPIGYIYFINAIDKMLIYLVTEKLDFAKYEQYWLLYTNSIISRKITGYCMLGLNSLHKGDFQQSIDYCEQSLKMFKAYKGIERKKVKNKFINLNKKCIEQANYFMATLDENVREQLLNLDISIEDTRRQAMKDILVNKKANDYFETSKSKNRLHGLYLSYYRALNAELKGDIETTRELFETLSIETEELFIVREAKKWLAENSVKH